MTCPRIIVALDFDNLADTMSLVQQLHPELCSLKVGSELFINCGIPLVERLMIAGFQVFVDLKLHDIPNTVYRACSSLAKLGVWMITLHAFGGTAMMQAAHTAITEANSTTILLAVTVLTSLDQANLAVVNPHLNLAKHVVQLAGLAKHAGCHGVVCSPFEAEAVKSQCGLEFITVTPGIRLNNPSVVNNDQKRVLTTRNELLACRAYIDYMVIGRAITDSPNPLQAFHAIMAQIQQ